MANWNCKTVDYYNHEHNGHEQVIYNKLAIVQKSKNDILANANFEVEKADILIAHYMQQLKDNLPEPMEDEEESANDGDKKPN